MDINLNFNKNDFKPTLVLSTKSGRKIGTIPSQNVCFSNSLTDGSEFNFSVYKELDGYVFPYWNKLKDFKLIHCVEWDKWYEIYVTVDESNELIKNVNATLLSRAELSQVNLYGIEINTETDIARDDYEPTILYDYNNPKASLLDRILDKVPNYRIKHVDSSIKDIQRTFAFDSTDILSAFVTISDEINCLFITDACTGEDGTLDRTVSVYDLESYCYECGHRDEFMDSCPNCGSNNVSHGYGEDTEIFISCENLADSINYQTDHSSVKNCFKLVAGDDLMTAVIASCNPNGSGYLWNISDEVKEDMSSELVDRLNSYDEMYEDKYKNNQANINPNILREYNALVDKYIDRLDTLTNASSSIVGYPALMQIYYDTIDFQLFLQSGLLPNIEIIKTTASDETKKITSNTLSPIAVQNIAIASASTVSNAVLSVAKTLVSPGFKVSINNSSYTNNVWTGDFIVSNYSDEEDTATTATVNVAVNDNYSQYVSQRIDKVLNGSVEDYVGIVDLFKANSAVFESKLKDYGLNPLNGLYEACQACIDVLIEQGVSDDVNADLYTTLYSPYYQKLGLISAEISLRESEIAIIAGVLDENGKVVKDGMQTLIKDEIASVNSDLNFEKYIGESLWMEFISYRREDTYSNDNYISDGLDNAAILKNALEFIKVAKKEIYKSANFQHSISASIKNFLAMEEFECIKDKFVVGNWIRLEADGQIYRLRLIDYSINDFENMEDLSVTFSDVKKVSTGISDTESLLNSMSSMAGSYGYVSRQASQGQEGNNKVKDWVNKGLALTNMKIFDNANNQNVVWDEHGMLFRRYDDILDDYASEQMKIINSTLAITDDNWRTIKTALGYYYYIDPVTGKMKDAYGLIAETIIGKLLLGENLGIYNDTNSLVFDRNGLNIFNDVNSFKVNPNSSNLVELMSGNNKLLYVDDKGMLHLSGEGSGLDISANNSVTGLSSQITTSINGLSANFSQQITETRTYAETQASNAQSNAIADTDGKLKNYSTTTEMNGAISLNAEKLTTDFNKTLTTTLGSYSTTEEMNNAINVSAEGINANIQKTYQTIDGANSSYSELSTEINAVAGKIDLKVGKDEVITQINLQPGNVVIDADKIDLNGLVEADEFVTKYASIANLDVTNLRVQNLEIDHVTVNDFNAAVAKIDRIDADYIDVTTFNADNATINGRIDSTEAKIGKIEADYISASVVKADYMEVANWTSAGYIKSDKIRVDELSAGVINAMATYSAGIKVTSLDVSGAFNYQSQTWVAKEIDGITYLVSNINSSSL